MKRREQREAERLARSAKVSLPAAQRALRRMRCEHPWVWLGAGKGLAALSTLPLLAVMWIVPDRSLLRLAIALGLILQGVVVLFVVVWYILRIRAVAREEEACPSTICLECGYNLRGVAEPRCPECGTTCGGPGS